MLNTSEMMNGITPLKISPIGSIDNPFQAKQVNTGGRRYLPDFYQPHHDDAIPYQVESQRFYRRVED
jgi:hypothetical protein